MYKNVLPLLVSVAFSMNSALVKEAVAMPSFAVTVPIRVRDKVSV
jgi:hypothetical protein